MSYISYFSNILKHNEITEPGKFICSLKAYSLSSLVYITWYNVFNVPPNKSELIKIGGEYDIHSLAKERRFINVSYFNISFYKSMKVLQF